MLPHLATKHVKGYRRYREQKGDKLFRQCVNVVLQAKKLQGPERGQRASADRPGYAL